MVDKKRSDQAAGGVFLIGLALLFMTGYWWPGILFVIGAGILATVPMLITLGLIIEGPCRKGS